MPSEKIVKLYVFGHQNAARLIIGLQSVCSVCVAVGESRWQHFNCSARKCRLHLNFEASRGRWLVFGSCRANQQPARQQLGSSWAAVGRQLSRPQAFISLSHSPHRGRLDAAFIKHIFRFPASQRNVSLWFMAT